MKTARILAAAAIGVAAIAGPAASASAVGVTPKLNQVTCETDPQSGFLRIDGSGGSFCYANAGSIDITLDGVYNVCSGDNDVAWDYDNNGGVSTAHLERKHCFQPPHVTIRKVTIL